MQIGRAKLTESRKARRVNVMGAALRHGGHTIPESANHAWTTPTTDKILAIRDRWHTKRHPFFRAFGEGKLALKAVGRYQALHYHYVSFAVRSFGSFYTRFYQLEDVRKMMAENQAEEEGFKAIPQAGHEPHNQALFLVR